MLTLQRRVGSYNAFNAGGLLSDVESTQAADGMPGYRLGLALDFSNTVSFHTGPNPKERLTGFDKLVSWGVGNGIISKAEGSLLAKAIPGERAKGKALARAIRLRDAVYGILAARARGKRPGGEAVDVLNAEVKEANAHCRLSMGGGGGFGWEWTSDDALGRLMWTVSKAASDLLTSDELRRVKQCANEEEGCGWLFFDMSRNQTRKWCDMSDCGNRLKARRFLRKSKDSAPRSSRGRPPALR